MIIRKRPIISWLLNMDNVEKENRFGVPMLANMQHFGYLSNGLQFLSEVRDTCPEWGLPELLMPSFEKVPSHFTISTTSFFRNFIRTMSAAYCFHVIAEQSFMASEKIHCMCGYSGKTTD